MKVLVDKDYLEDGLELICDSIRLKTGGTGVLAFPVEIKQAVDAIETGAGGITPTGTKTITENGEGIDVTTFAAVDVAVPTGVDESQIAISNSEKTGTVMNAKQLTFTGLSIPDGKRLIGLRIERDPADRTSGDDYINHMFIFTSGDREINTNSDGYFHKFPSNTVTLTVNSDGKSGSVDITGTMDGFEPGVAYGVFAIVA